MDDRERLREECQTDLQALRVEGLLSERAFRLLEKLVTRLDRLETGSFSTEERPTEPEQRARLRCPITFEKTGRAYRCELAVGHAGECLSTNPEPERRKSSTKWRNDAVLRELDAGKKTEGE